MMTLSEYAKIWIFLLFYYFCVLKTTHPSSSSMIVLLIFYLLAPAGVLWLCRKVPFCKKIGPILILYGLGMVEGNLPWMPDGAEVMQKIVTAVTIPLAIPMLLFNFDFLKFSFRKSLLTLLCGVVSVAIAVVVGLFLFRTNLGYDGPKVGAMLAGLCTGGAPNLAALKLMLGAKEETYMLMRSYDIVVAFVYLFFLMSIGITLCRKFLPTKNVQTKEINTHYGPDPYRGFFCRKCLGEALKALALSIVIAGVSVGAGLLVNEAYLMIVAVLMLTSLGIAASFVPSVRSWEHGFDAGMYLVYIFSIVVASMADFSAFDFKDSVYLLLYLVFAIFVSLCVQALISKIVRIDADTMVISSVALITAPPMVPMVAAAMKNPNVMVIGLGVGVVGYAIGNYFGLLIYHLLSVICQ